MKGGAPAGQPLVEAPPPPGLARVVLVGFMTSGKSTVGPELARLWGWSFLDFDEEIARRAGCSIAEFFARWGEAEFRAAEAALTAEVADLERVVLAPGGGWITQPDLLPLLRARAVVVWLRITPEEAARRSALAPHHRPLLAGPDPLSKARVLMDAREPLYRLADLVVDVDGRSREAVAREIAHRVHEI